MLELAGKRAARIVLSGSWVTRMFTESTLSRPGLERDPTTKRLKMVEVYIAY